MQADAAEATNAKIIRTTNLHWMLTECEREPLLNTHQLAQCQRYCKTAILMILAGVDAQQSNTVVGAK